MGFSYICKQCATIYAMNYLLRTAREAARLWFSSSAAHMAATVSYYMIFAMIPLLLISVAINSVIFGTDFIFATLSKWGSVLGPEVLELLRTAVGNLEVLSAGFGIPLLGTLFFSFMIIIMCNTFTSGLHDIWSIPHHGFPGWLQKTKHSVLFIIVFEGYLFLMLLLSYLFTVIKNYIPGFGIVLLDAGAFLLMTTLLFSLMFRILPRQSPALYSRFWGSFIASVFLFIVRSLVVLYIDITPIPSLFGVAGLLIVLLIWTYVATAIVYYGAAFAFVHGDRQLR